MAVIDSIGIIIKHNRELCGFSLRTLASRTGLSSSYISQIENGKVSPSLSSLVKVADALGTTIQGLFEEVSLKDENPVIRKENRRLESTIDKGVKISFATNSVLSRTMEVAVVELQKGAETGNNAAVYKRFGNQIMFVHKGKVEARLGENVLVLNEGDSLNMVSDALHSARNIHTGISEIIFFVVPR